MIKSSSLFIGADGGGTKTKMRLEDAKGQCLAETISGPSNISTNIEQAWESINTGIATMLESANITASIPLYLGLGLAGVELENARKHFLNHKSAQRFAKITLISDAYAACIGTHNGQDGAIIIVGTGTNGFLCQGHKQHQVAGWGFPHSDEGGGAWLGMEAMRASLRAIDGRIAPSILSAHIFKHFNQDFNHMVHWANRAAPADFGELAPLVVQCAKENDALANDLLNKSAHYIDLISQALLKQQAPNSQALPLVLLGGLAPIIQTRTSDATQERIVARQFGAAKGALMYLQNQLQKESSCP